MNVCHRGVKVADNGAVRKAALYGVVRTQYEQLCLVLARAFCLECDWDWCEYVDIISPQGREGSEWRRLLADVAKGDYYVVVTWQNARGMDDYCHRYGAQWALFVPDTSQARTARWRRLKVGL